MHKYEPIMITSFDQLLSEEQEIIHRINQKPNGGRLLLVDPLRLFTDVGVHISDEVIAHWDANAGGGLFAATGRELAYDTVLSSDAEADSNKVYVAGLFSKERSI